MPSPFLLTLFFFFYLVTQKSGVDFNQSKTQRYGSSIQAKPNTVTGLVASTCQLGSDARVELKWWLVWCQMSFCKSRVLRAQMLRESNRWEGRRKKKRTCCVRTSNSLHCRCSGLKVLSLHGNVLFTSGHHAYIPALGLPLAPGHWRASQFNI